MLTLLLIASCIGVGVIAVLIVVALLTAWCIKKLGIELSDKNVALLSSGWLPVLLGAWTSLSFLTDTSDGGPSGPEAQGILILLVVLGLAFGIGWPVAHKIVSNKFAETTS
ncbi:hypothetical protein [Qipengyuania sp.]|uniref:hypothetical protein n=1 Tax=Qipengyuania sp. TaxID=2004515 RepID=UPI0035123DB4